MAFENCVVTHNTPENLETIGDAGFAYDGKTGAADLRRVLEELLRDPELVRLYRHKARQRAQSVYSWETVTDLTNACFIRYARGHCLNT